jgi:hypothetical protein
MRALRRWAIVMLVLGAWFVAAGHSRLGATTGPGASFVYSHPVTPTRLVTPGRVFEAAAGDATGSTVVMYGGQVPNGNAAFGDTWVNGADGVWKPTCGTAIHGATGPCGPGTRDGLGMGDARGGVVLYGGFPGALGNAPSGDTWRWNGTTWTRVCTTATCGPGPRGLMAMAGNGDQTVMFGGISGSGLANDTWVFNGSSWTQACGQAGRPCGPIGLAGAAMAWDGQQFVLFGGDDISGSAQPPVDDTWTFNGHAWTKVCGTSMSKPCGPAARDLSGFAYAGNPRTGELGAMLAEGGDLFGSGPTQHFYRDGWFFDGTRWTRLSPPWNGATLSFPNTNNGSPPAGPDPLLGVMASKPAVCETLYLGTLVARAGAPPTLAETTFVTGRTPWTATKPNCDVAATVGTMPASTTTVAAPAHIAAPANPTLPATGANAPGPTKTFGLVLVTIGAVMLACVRKRARA